MRELEIYYSLGSGYNGSGDILTFISAGKAANRYCSCRYARHLRNSWKVYLTYTTYTRPNVAVRLMQILYCRDRTCTATSMRINSNRIVNGKTTNETKKSASRPDLVLIKNGTEYGSSEVGKGEDAVTAKKELVETQLHGPKLMKDIFLRAAKEADNNISVTRALRTISFYRTGKETGPIREKWLTVKLGRRMRLSLLDCPAGFVWRVMNTEEYEIPLDSKLIHPYRSFGFKMRLIPYVST